MEALHLVGAAQHVAAVLGQLLQRAPAVVQLLQETATGQTGMVPLRHSDWEVFTPTTSRHTNGFNVTEHRAGREVLVLHAGRIITGKLFR